MEITLKDTAVKLMARHGLNRWLINDQSIPGSCFLCYAPSGRLPVCTPCLRELPLNRDPCPVCALPDCHGQICAECLGAAGPALDVVIAPFRYSYPVDRVIQEMKFHARPGLAGFFALAYHGLAEAGLLVLPEQLIPIPLHRGRLRERGYNQSACLARAFSAATGIPATIHTLQRLRPTIAQSGLKRPQRRRNMRGAFALTANADVRGRHLALIDDVMTTGATLREAARALKRAGASRVDAWVCARPGQE